jgi:hypothetical protein
MLEEAPPANAIVPRVVLSLPQAVVPDIKLSCDDSPVEQPFVADLILFYAFDQPSYFTMVAHRDLIRLALDEPRLHDIALTNLQRIIPQLNCMSSQAESSCLLAAAILRRRLCYWTRYGSKSQERCKESWSPLFQREISWFLPALGTARVWHSCEQRSREFWRQAITPLRVIFWSGAQTSGAFMKDLRPDLHSAIPLVRAAVFSPFVPML